MLNELWAPRMKHMVLGNSLSLLEPLRIGLLAWRRKHIPSVSEVTLKKREARRRVDICRNCGRETAEWVEYKGMDGSLRFLVGVFISMDTVSD
jgi:hypothetical protein